MALRKIGYSTSGALTAISMLAFLLTRFRNSARLNRMTDDALLECPPNIDGITSYDEQHFVTYIRLLDADAEGADWREAVQIIFALDPDQNPQSSKRIHENHLARAKWMTTNGYKHLLDMQKR
jgi:hypothetical protein